VRAETDDDRTRAAERRDARDARDAVVLVVLVWAAGVLPRLAAALTGPRGSSAVGEQAAAGPLPDLLGQVLVLAVGVWCAAVVLARRRDLPRDRLLPLLLLLLPWGWLLGRDLFGGDRPDAQGLLLPVVVVGLWVLRPRLEQLRVLGLLVVATAGLAVAMGLVLPGVGIYRTGAGDPVDAGESLVPLGILAGPYTSGNNLGQVLVLGAPAVLLLRGRAARVAGGALVAAALVWTSSRSSLAALVAGVAAAAVLAGGGRGRAVLAALGVAGATAVSALLPLTVVGDPEAFTNRGLIWAGTVEAWRQHPVVGQGTAYYTDIAGTTDAIAGSAFHAHHQGLQTLVTGGVVLAALVLLLVLAAGVEAVRRVARGQTYPAVHLVVLAVSCALEVSVGFVDRDLFLVVTLLPVAWSLLGRRPARRPARPRGPSAPPAATGPVRPARAARRGATAPAAPR